MRKKGILVSFCVVMAFVMGCGVPPYELTDSESEIISNYAAHIVSKYNLYQQDGIIYVEEDTEEEEEEIAADTSTETTEEEDQSNGELVASEGSEEEAEATQTATFDDIFGSDNIHIDCKDARIATSYVEDTYYAMDADADEVYVIVDIDVTNNGTDAVETDFLSRQPSFRVTVNGEYQANSEMTILMNDFSTYDEEVPAGETVGTVLIFQVPEEVTDITSIDLTVSVDGSNYKIELPGTFVL
jgi:hypothetical protein